MRWIKRIIAVAAMLMVLVAGVSFAVQNGARVTLDLLVMQLPPLRIATLLLVAFALGGLAGIGAGSVALLRLQAARRGMQRRLQRCEQELDQLRATAKS